MHRLLFYTDTRIPALKFCAEELIRCGFSVSPVPCPSVSHVILPIPSAHATIPENLPENAVIFGGWPESPPFPAVNLLQDEWYLGHNAAITAQCAIKILLQQLPRTLRACPVAIIGWGRIGKILAFFLQELGADVTVVARSEKDRGILSALGYGTVDFSAFYPQSFRVIFNTVPAPILPQTEFSENILLIDLASIQGLPGDAVIHARGLPGKEMPESSGKLIARAVLRHVLGKEKL